VASSTIGFWAANSAYRQWAWTVVAGERTRPVAAQRSATGQAAAVGQPSLATNVSSSFSIEYIYFFAVYKLFLSNFSKNNLKKCFKNYLLSDLRCSLKLTIFLLISRRRHFSLSISNLYFNAKINQLK
jgi:hypothetical protein